MTATLSYANTFNYFCMLNNMVWIRKALDSNIISKYHFDIMSTKNLPDLFGIGYHYIPCGNVKLTLPDGMRFEYFHNGIIYLVNVNKEILYSMDYRTPAYDMKTPEELAPY